MANCPNCNHKLKITDWRQNCPECGCNMLLYGIQDRMMDDADKAEVEHYYFQKKIDRLKASFVGSKFAITRIVTSLLPVAGVLLPLVKAVSNPPLPDLNGNLSAITLYNVLSKSGIDVSVFQQMLSSSDKAAAVCLLVSVATLLLSVLALLVHFVCLTMACSPKGKKRNFTLDSLMLVFAVVSAVMFAAMPQNAYINGTLQIGAFAYILLIIVNFVIDFLTYKYAKPIKHAQCFVGGIPIEEYFRMKDEGADKETLREEMYRRLNEQQRLKDIELAEREAETERTVGQQAREDKSQSDADEAAAKKNLTSEQRESRRVAARVSRQNERGAKFVRKNKIKAENIEKKLGSIKNDKKRALLAKKLYRARINSNSYADSEQLYSEISGSDDLKKRAADAYELFYYKSNFCLATGGRLTPVTAVLAVAAVALIFTSAVFIQNDVKASAEEESIAALTSAMTTVEEAAAEETTAGEAVTQEATEESTTEPVSQQADGEAVTQQPSQETTEAVSAAGEETTEELPVAREKYGNDNIIIALICAIATTLFAAYTFGSNRKIHDMVLKGVYSVRTCRITETKRFTTDRNPQYRISYTLKNSEHQKFVSESMFELLKGSDYVSCIDLDTGAKSFFEKDNYIIPPVCAESHEKEAVTK